jgi:hypothetical protein
MDCTSGILTNNVCPKPISGIPSGPPANFKAPLLGVLNDEPMYEVLSNDQMGFDLGAVFSLVNLQYRVKSDGLFCLPSCTTQQWQTMWNRMFYYYNTQEAKYQNNPNEVILNGNQYEPK